MSSSLLRFFFELAQFALVLRSDFENSPVSDRNRLPWIFEPLTRHSFSDDPRLQSLDLCQYGRRWRMTTGFFFLWQHRSARHGAFEPQMPWENGNVLANTSASPQSHVSQSWESVVVDDRQKPTRLFEQSSHMHFCPTTSVAFSLHYSVLR